eukprot:g4041.t1
MSRLTAVFFVILLGACAVQGRSTPDWNQYLHANTRASAYAYTKYGTSDIKMSTGASTSYRVHKATAEVMSEAISSIYTGATADSAAYAVAEAIGKVLAEVFVENSAEGYVYGDGVVSGNAHADAYSYAETTSTAIAGAYSAATNYKYKAEAEALAVALSKALAEAYATMTTDVEVVSGGYVEGYYAIYVEAFAEAITHAIAVALSKVQEDYENGGSYSTTHAAASSYFNDGSYRTRTQNVYQRGNGFIRMRGDGDHIVHQFQRW